MRIASLISILILFLFSLFSSLCFANLDARHFPPGTYNVFIANSPKLNNQPLQRIAPLVQSSIANGYYPGAVILAAWHGQIIYRGVFGSRRITPNIAPMRFDTIFDLASLTKVVVTTTAILQLVDQNKLRLDAPVAEYWPAFASQGKSHITVRQLLTHTSGLPEDLPSVELYQLLNIQHMPVTPTWHGQAAALQQIVQLKPQHPPGTTVLYSDINFIVLGYLVERISGKHLDEYAQQFIFKPLGMQASYFSPSSSLRDRIAPTQIVDGVLRWGEVHDPTVYLMGGVCGMAGLFSDASDLGIFAQSILNRGRLPAITQAQSSSAYLLKPTTVRQMVSHQTPRNTTEIRSLGWDIHSKYSCGGNMFSSASFGHTGWTGTSLWIDPVNQAWLIILTSRTHPFPADHNKLLQDRIAIADMVGEAIKQD